MKLLLDTQTLLWWRQGDRRLGTRARAAITRHATSVQVSAASAWEIAIKSATRRLTLREPLPVWMTAAVDDSGFDALDVTVEHAVAVAGLPRHHADPFDRLLIAQAQLEHLIIVTSDTVFDSYEVQDAPRR